MSTKDRARIAESREALHSLFGTGTRSLAQLPTLRPLPVTERLTRHTLVLPLHHRLTAADQERVVGVLRRLSAGLVATGGVS